MIGPEVLAFLEEAKKAFEDNPYWETYIDKNDGFVALRMGLDRDCIEVYKLSHRVANFSQQIEPVFIERKVTDQRQDFLFQGLF